MDTAAKLTDEEIREAKSERLMETIAWRAAYYRANPQRFVKDFTKVELRPFQQILIWAMNVSDHFYFIAARSLGKG